MDKITREMIRERNHIQHFYTRLDKTKSLKGIVRMYIDVQRHVSNMYTLLQEIPKDKWTQEQHDTLIEVYTMQEKIMDTIAPYKEEYEQAFTETYDTLMQSDLTNKK